MSQSLTLARPEDIPQLVDLMAEFYAESGYSMDRTRASEVFHDLLADRSLGRVWLIFLDEQTAGYVILTLGYSLEYGGRDAFVDDLYLRPPFRGQGLGKLALAELRATCVELGVRALHLEVERDNQPAALLYHRTGFVGHGRQLLTLRLEDERPEVSARDSGLRAQDSGLRPEDASTSPES